MKNKTYQQLLAHYFPNQPSLESTRIRNPNNKASQHSRVKLVLVTNLQYT